MIVTWRTATPNDLPRILELWDEQELRFAGTQIKVDRPELFDEKGFCFPVMNVAVAEKQGSIVGFRYSELVPEMAIITGDEDVMKSLGDELTREAHNFKQIGFRSGWGLVPERFAKAMARFLKNHPHIRPWKSLTPVGIDFSELGD
jgi:hypothetical protein